MPLDGLTATLLANDLNSMFETSKVEKIFQPEIFDIHLKLRKDGSTKTLVLSSAPSQPCIYINSNISENPASPYRFCTILRKHLSGARLISVDTLSSDRIFEFTFQTVDEIGDISKISLIVEIMGKRSNIILVNNNKIIIDSISHVDSSVSRLREIMPGRKYIVPENQNKKSLKTVLDDIENFLISAKCEKVLISKYIVENIYGFSPLIARDLLEKSNLSDICCDSIELHKYSEFLKTGLIEYNAISKGSNIKPCVLYSENNPNDIIDFYAFPFGKYSRLQFFDNYIDAISYYYNHKKKSDDFKSKKEYFIKLLSTKLKNYETKHALHVQETENSKDFEKLKQTADLLLSYSYIIKSGSTGVNLQDYYNNNEQIFIELDSRYSVAANAQLYYKRYNKMKQKNIISAEFATREALFISYIQSLINLTINSVSHMDLSDIMDEINSNSELKAEFQKPNNIQKGQSIKGKKKPQKKANIVSSNQNYRVFISSDGLEILAGRNNLQNDYITFKIASPDDLWFHIQKSPGTHVILRCKGTAPLNSSIEEAAMVSAWYSRNEVSRNTSAIIDYCVVSNVKKIPRSSPGNVIYSNYKTVLVNAKFPESLTIVRP